MESVKVIEKLESMRNEKNIEGMKRFGINGARMLGISVYDLRKLAKEIGRNHILAMKLWKSGIHEARMLAVFIDEPSKVTENQMERWAKDFDSWDICDQACTDLFDRTAFNWKKAKEWSSRNEEFVKRGAFALMAGLAVHDKDAEDADFESLFSLIKKESVDEHNFVKKAVNWALRNIGKRNAYLNGKAIKVCGEIINMDSSTARWIGKDALRELKSDNVKKRLARRK